MSEKIAIEVIAGVAGACLVINGSRVAGPKPWGGGQVTQSWECDADQILSSLPHQEKDE